MHLPERVGEPDESGSRMTPGPGRSDGAGVPADKRSPLPVVADGPVAGVAPDLSRLQLEALLRELISRADDVLRAHGKLSGLLDAVVSIAGDLSLPVVLRRIVEAAAALADAEYGALGVLDSDHQQLVEFHTVGIDEALREQIGEPPHGHGILGELIADPRPLRLTDLTSHPRSYGFPPHHPAMRSFLGVPIRVRGEVFGNLYLTEKRGGGQFTTEDEEVVSALGVAAAVAIENARLFEETRRRQLWLAASTEITAALLSGRGPHDALELIAKRAQSVADADLVAILVPVDGSDQLVAQVAAGPAADRQQVAGLLVPAERSLSGDVLKSGKPRRIEDAGADPKKWSEADTLVLGPAVVAPLGSTGQVRGVLLVSNMPGGAVFSAAEEEMVTGFAGHAALAMEFARVQSDRERLAVFEDRDRIARDLHDLVIQRLFAVGLGLQGITRLVSRPEVASRIEESVDDLDETVREIRRTIFSLQGARAGTSSLRAQVLEICSEVAGPLGFEPIVRLEGPLDSVVPDDIGGQLVATLREALSNAVRHAAASRVEVAARVDSHNVRLQVSDNGQGIDPTATRRSGLANLSRRAERLGGQLRVDSAPGHGTQLSWQVPLG